jgi:hypothetical protein
MDDFSFEFMAHSTILITNKKYIDSLELIFEEYKNRCAASFQINDLTFGQYLASQVEYNRTKLKKYTQKLAELHYLQKQKLLLARKDLQEISYEVANKIEGDTILSYSENITTNVPTNVPTNKAKSVMIDKYVDHVYKTINKIKELMLLINEESSEIRLSKAISLLNCIYKHIMIFDKIAEQFFEQMRIELEGLNEIDHLISRLHNECLVILHGTHIIPL